ncbi:MAG: hypothetical protein KC442_08530 [Thermomicrobiales bacterium]|nr:hypothetical protein [Thermomicrobiales bacterium]
MGIADLHAHDRVGIDTSLLIYHLESNPEFLEVTRRMFDQIHVANIQVVASVITITELLTKPFRYGSAAMLPESVI